MPTKKCFYKKAPENQRLVYVWFWMVYVIDNRLFSHAEMLEDVAEDFVRGDYSLACYFCELREYDAQVFGDEVAAIVVIESLNDTCECLVCA